MRDHLPGLAPWAEWCYGASSRLLFGDHIVDSAAGAQQGDPLGPLLFSLALQPVLAEMARAGAPGEELDLCFGYLDDGVVAGHHAAVARAFATLQRLAPGIGLRLNLDKCEFVPAAGAAAFTGDRAVFPAEFTVVTDGCFELLGAPVGSPAFCAAYT